MTESGNVTEDRGLKALFTSYPIDTVEVFAPGLLAAHGRPATIEAVQQEIPLHDLSEPSRFLDVALLCTWADGYRASILLVEHWSEARKVDLERVNLYVAGLRVKHRCDVLPIILVTDSGLHQVPDRLVSIVDGVEVIDFRVRVVRLGPGDLPRLRNLQVRNLVAGALLTLAITDGVESVASAAEALIAAGMTPDDLRRFLSLLMKLGRITNHDIPRLRHRLRQEPRMINVLDEIFNEGQAAGKAEGKAEGARAVVDAIRRMVARGALPVDAAKAEIQELIDSQAIPEAIGRDALSQLG